MYDMMKNQNFGVEIELNGITRESAAKTIAAHFGTTAHYIGTGYRTYTASDRKGVSGRPCGTPPFLIA